MTVYAELDEILRELSTTAHRILGDNFVGAYLQGSFALGDADRESDCDFLIPVHRPITPTQEAALRVLHDEIPTREGYWNRRLEGSYPLLSELRTLDGLGRDWLYIDNGWREMQWSAHCNTEVVRWTLREYGVTLAGPDPKSLVDVVPAEVLRARMRADIPQLLPGLATWISIELAWGQRYAVTTLCRMLHTLADGRISSKRAALLWAIDTLDPEWSGLCRRALDGRALGWDPEDTADSGEVQRTVAFAAFATATATARD
ncbi:aminoglycoside adenylyltransferase domain-containing protein [Kribbella sp. NPDC051770]|uniref:aminoglycoside adenylyltransferase domain-containing protein n=1 Tax=Kribbella sp. NPDC051770 TaxID=3155413 RepID=UPI00343FF6FC